MLTVFHHGKDASDVTGEKFDVKVIFRFGTHSRHVEHVDQAYPFEPVRQRAQRNFYRQPRTKNNGRAELGAFSAAVTMKVRQLKV